MTARRQRPPVGIAAANDPSSVPPAAAVLRYPTEVSDWWRARAERDGLAPERIAAAAGRLSDRFTTERPAAFDEYFRAPEARLAYGWLFFPQAWVRTRFPLAEVVDFRGWRFPADRPLHVVDVGAGQGAAGLSAAQWLVARGLAPSVRLTAVDRSREALGDLLELRRDLPAVFPATSLDVVARDVRAPGAVEDLVPSADLVVVGFALNEVAGGEDPDSTARRVRALLPSGGLLLLLEPATREASLRLDAVVTRLLAEGHAHTWGPDLLHRPADPAAAHWPYESRRWRPPPTVERVNATLWRSLRELTFSYAVLAAAPAPVLPPTPGTHRLVSPVRRQKGLVAWSGRASDGETYDYEVLRRDVDRDDPLLDERDGLERGDVLTLSAWTEHPGRRVRLASARAIASRFRPR